MKKILFSLVALMCSMSMNAQVMKVMKNGEVEATYKGSEYSVVFEEEQGSTTTGTAKATIGGSEVDVNWVQLWKDGPKFAEYNVGVTDGKAESYGGYYCWGSSIDKDPSAAYKEGTKALTGTDDTATNLWGNNWRMPTKAELDDLLANCDVAWITVNGVNGCKFTGKGDFASNSVFLPATGYYYDGYVRGRGDHVYYWSSTPSGSDHACSLFFNSGGQTVFNGIIRSKGHSVRAVLVESDSDEESGEDPSELSPGETASTTIGTAKATIGGSEIDVKWVQLWENGPKFAEYNVGVTDGKAESYGGYYCWGGSIDQDPYDAYRSGTGALTGDDDTATKLWGSAWRMPTGAELEDLLANCDVAWTTVNGENVCKFTGKGDFASNSVFLPAAGYCLKGNVRVRGDGNYWSSTPNGRDLASSLYFLLWSDLEVSDGGRDYGCSVRAVLAE